MSAVQGHPDDGTVAAESPQDENGPAALDWQLGYRSRARDPRFPLPSLDPLRRAQRLHNLFERQCDLSPTSVAIVCGSTELTYADLDAAANRLARHLQEHGVVSGSRAGILLERSVNTYIALLAVLKAGAAFVPLDPSFPPDRVAFIAEDAGLRAILTTSTLAAAIAAPSPLLELDRIADAVADCSPARLPAERAADADDLCYIIYTSGTTGRPKGVAVGHPSICNFLEVVRDVYGVTSTDRVYQGMTIAFDFSIEEIWPAWLVGATVVAAPVGDGRFGDGLARFLIEQRITVLCCVPTLLATIDQDVPSLRLLLVGGEQCPADLVARWSRPGLRMLNTYGPTETTVTATCAELKRGHAVTIGRPLPTYKIHILDPDLNPVPCGALGEIHIGGIGVARGYVNRPELTREKFIPDFFAGPYEPYARLYKTGDLGRFTADGDIECLGRIDTQVKIRGYRIELTEIESVLLECPEVENAIVATWPPAGEYQELVGYIKPRCAGRPLPLAALQRNLRQRLPPYMVPAYFEPISEVPVLPSGKADRSRLPAPTTARLCLGANAYVEPDSPLESAIAVTWAQVLNQERVSVEDDFFQDLGGHSLFAARLVSALRRDPRLSDLGVADLYANPTIRRLAHHVEAHPAYAATTSDEAVSRTESASACRARENTRRALCCGATQAVVLYVLMAIGALPFLAVLFYLVPVIDFLALRTLAIIIPIIVLAGPSLVVLSALTVPLVFKWLVIGRYRSGSYPVWGSYYVRWWLVQKAESLAAPLSLLAGSPLISAYARLWGVKVGRDCYLGTSDLHVGDMIEIGDGASIGYGTHVCGYRIENGMLHIDRVRIGNGCYVGSASVILPGAVMEDRARLGDQSLLAGDQTIPADASWSGSPARPDQAPDPVIDTLAAQAAASPTGRRGLSAGYVLGLTLLALPIWVATVPGYLLLIYLGSTYSGYWYLLGTPAAAVIFVVCFGLGTAAFKYLLMRSITPGLYSIRSWFYLRKWMVDRLMDNTLAMADAVYATLYLPPWLRLLGASIGRRAEVSTASYITPNLLRIDDESFVADAACIGPARVFNNMLMLAPTQIGCRSFLGNAAFLPCGGALAERCLLGVLSVPPATPAEPGTDWLGSPAMFLPRRQQSECFPETLTFTPTRRLYAERLAIEFFRIVLPPTLWFATAALGIHVLLQLTQFGSLTLLATISPLLYLALALTATLVVVGIKYLLIGTYRPLVRPLWSHFVRRTELVTGLYENVTAPMLLSTLTGTPFAAPILRLFGVKIGRRVWIETSYITEFDLVSIGDDSEIGMFASLQTHLFEDRVMKMSHVRIGRGCTVGARSIVLYDSVMEDGASLDALSLLMKGETLSAGSRWRGIPARRCG